MTSPDLEPDCEAGCAPPREIEHLFGHDTAMAQFDTAQQYGRLHHAWMITGPKGVGKASFAYKAAMSLLAGSSDAASARQKVRAQAHPNLLTIRRPWDDKRKRWRGEVTIDEVRRVPDFFSRSGGEDGWRIVIVDSMDEFNRNAANGLLKTLEEPPKRGLLLLVTHSPGRLLPTIRSRCRQLDLRAPSVVATRDWLVDGHGVSVAEAQAASELAAGAPGRALALLQSGAVGLEKDVRDLLGRLPNWDTRASRRLAAKVSTKAGESLRPHLYASLTRNAARLAREAAQNGVAPEPWLDAWKAIQGLESEAEGVYLDAKQAALAAFAHMESAARASRL
ncbi:DNA polymerase III subunit delta' [Hyphobacterium sp. CCMP332]|uniref:DNA polymerase III subunit delta' n=1 Tax=Hyphobacterium sp. CCMP332 TaxID=2749086 RepID=UPI00164EFA7A|nr:DNA polymerase III subunit delta' [Hyphobacterium sp. CCMP332]QNL18721.1 DNA polymerase III subunit delta' [Hyphobacterium sp. CCMP332]